jgi:hypothetical protein
MVRERADMSVMTSDEAPARTYACVPCDVTWKSAVDSTCWMCGRDVAVATTETVLSNATGAAHMSAAPTNYAGTRLTRWGTSFLEAQARGLPDPRYPVQHANT